MKARTLTRSLSKAIRSFPAVVLTGPRQSGKTTLLKMLFSKTHRFVSLENLDIRSRAKEDPLNFLSENPPPVILDEIQYLPELFSYIKTQIDEKRKPGQWLFTGSQNFSLMQGASQSLAGRAAILSLLPFSAAESADKGSESLDPPRWLKALAKGPQTVSTNPSLLARMILRGSYPEIASKKAVDRTLWCSSYIATYLERDVRTLAGIGDLNHFERFLRLCAARTGQFLHQSEFAREIGVSVPTIARWISILEASYQVFLLYPYYKNLGKRLVKAPKLYFTDTGLATYLMGIHDAETLLKSPNFGSIFESWIVVDVLKRFLNAGQMPALYYIRTRDGLEVDLVVETGQKLYLFEIKTAMAVFPKHASGLTKLKADLKAEAGAAYLISRSPENFKLTVGVQNLNWGSTVLL